MLGDDWLNLNYDELCDAFDQWLHDVADMGYWSADNPNGQRIHWKSLNAASNHPSKKPQLNSPGCYMFGWGSGYDTVVPRYIGKTGKSKSKGKNTLVGRLRNRYIPTKRFNLHPEDSKIRQCAIATWLTENVLANIDGGWKQLPDKFDCLILRHYKNFGPRKNEVRSKINRGQSASEIVKHGKTHYKAPLAVRHGEDFAKFGIDEIWFAIFPVSYKATAKKLEDSLKHIVRQWNRNNGRCDIINKL